MSATNQFPPPHLIPEDDTIDHMEENSDGQNINSSGNDDKSTQQLALPSTEIQGSTQQLEVSTTGEVKHTISFDHLGPLVINRDGTLSRIHNWAEMTEAEQARTVRVLGKRNMLRKEAILKDD